MHIFTWLAKPWANYHNIVSLRHYFIVILEHTKNNRSCKSDLHTHSVLIIDHKKGVKMAVTEKLLKYSIKVFTPLEMGVGLVYIRYSS
jgi:hypothetical protein